MFALSDLRRVQSTSPESIRDLWVLEGTLQCNSYTRIYRAGSIMQVKEGNLNNAIIYIKNDLLSQYDWTQSALSINDDGSISDHQGTASEYFYCILTPEEYINVETIDINADLDLSIFNSTQKWSIDDHSLTLILSLFGVPFVSIDELELTRDQIIEICVAPTLHYYFEKFPIEVTEDLGYKSAGSSFCIEFPDDLTHSAEAWYTIGNGSSNGTTTLRGLMAEQRMYGAGSSYFNHSIRYNKNVPGYTGSSYGAAANGLLGLMTNQAYLNFFRREQTRIKRVDHKKYLEGCTSIGGNLCVKWLKSSNDWEDIDYEFVTDAISLARGHALMNIGALRELCRTDLPGNLSDQQSVAQGKELINDVYSRWGEASNKLAFGIKRGGLNI